MLRNLLIAKLGDSSQEEDLKNYLLTHCRELDRIEQVVCAIDTFALVYHLDAFVGYLNPDDALGDILTDFNEIIAALKLTTNLGG